MNQSFYNSQALVKELFSFKNHYSNNKNS